MYTRPLTRQKPRSAIPKSFGAPVAGWIANRALSAPGGLASQQGAAILDNFFPSATTAYMRRGRALYAVLGDGTKDCLSEFSYNVGALKRLFAATESTIYNITVITDPNKLTTGLEVWTGALGGEWSVVQFATTGGTYLLGVNGASVGFIYDGTNFWPNVKGGVFALNYDAEVAPFTAGATITGGTSGSTAKVFRVVDNGSTGILYINTLAGTFQDNEAITGGGGSATVNGAVNPGIAIPVVPGVAFGATSLTTADMAFVWAYQNRLLFIQKQTLTFWYLPIDSIGGTATAYPLGGVFGEGGSLLIGQSWSLESGQGGGLSEQCAIVTTEGEVAIYQGTNPAQANQWGKVGVYKIGKPLGAKAFLRAGGDLIIGSTIGAVPLSQAIQRDAAALSPAAISYPIEDAWNEAVDQRGETGWSMVLWPESQMMLVSPPTNSGSKTPVVFVANARTGAWARFTNWRALCMHIFNGRLFLGSTNGKVYAGNESGLDDRIPYTSVYLPLFDDFGAPVAEKVAELGRARLRGNSELDITLEFHTDFNMDLPPPPSASIISGGSQWGIGKWGPSAGAAKWGDTRKQIVDQDWQSIGGIGYACSMSMQVTSGSPVPLDAEIISLELTYTIGDIGP